MLIHKKLLKRPVDGDLGVEIEVEGDNLPSRGLDHWRIEEDTSLRGESAEYVLARPYKLEGVQVALKELENAYKDCGTEVRDSIRAGVHVHVNVNHIEEIHLYNFITAYLVLEDTLVHWCGPNREGNLFCLRCSDAEAWLDLVRPTILSGNFKGLMDDDIRYSSINLKAVPQYGSVEFRAMRSTDQFELIEFWCKLLLHIRDVSCTFNSPKEVVALALEDRAKFFEVFVGEFGKELDYAFFEKTMPRCVRHANDFANIRKDWNSVALRQIGQLNFPDDGIDYHEPLEDF